MRVLHPVILRQELGGVNGAEITNAGGKIHHVSVGVAAEAVEMLGVKAEAGALVRVEGTAGHAAGIRLYAQAPGRLRHRHRRLYGTKQILPIRV